jgi:hypothetical protein
MYQVRFLLVTLFLFWAGSSIAQGDPEAESLGLPGDNLNLYAVLKLFQECQTLEEFEQKLNSEDNNINNLDLDSDEQIDYITVTDNVKDNVHSITLEVSLNKDEKQGVAVFVVSKDGDDKVQIQVVGDEDLYGKDYIIEPQYDDKSTGTPNPGYQGNQQQQQPAQQYAQPKEYEVKTTTYVQVYSWPIVRFMYVPTYNPWRSPWYWGYYPGWWRPWRPHYWHWYYGYHYHWNYYYFGYYRRWGYYRHPGWYGWYYGNNGWRRRSNYYYSNYHAGRYRKTYSRPESISDGSANFKTKYPKAPTVNKMPPTAKVPTFKPDLVKPSPKPGVSKPSTKPGTTVPGTKPGVSKPSTKPGTTGPSTRPTTPGTSTRPSTRPGTTSPGTRPSTRPPVTKPAPKPPVSRPSPKPSARPATPAKKPVAPSKKGGA